ncbi:MAG TPA: hypothetical protein V6C86_24320 [Oculatellaceae cyanobacterium]
MPVAINKRLARKVLSIVDQGLCGGMGVQEPGKMCVEAAVCYALGEPHSDQPSCVAPEVRSFKIKLNDSNWSSNEARAKGLRRIAIAQLGTKEPPFDALEFSKRVTFLAVTKWTPKALRSAAKIAISEEEKQKLLAAAKKCEKLGANATLEELKNAAANAAYAAYAAANAANAAYDKKGSAARDRFLAACAEDVVQVLIDLKAPGTKFLSITEEG